MGDFPGMGPTHTTTGGPAFYTVPGSGIRPNPFLEYLTHPVAVGLYQQMGSKIGNILLNSIAITALNQMRNIGERLLGKLGQSQQILAFKEVGEALELERGGERTFLSDLQEQDPESFEKFQREAGLLAIRGETEEQAQANEQARKDAARQEIYDRVTSLYQELGDQSKVYYAMAKLLFKDRQYGDLTPQQLKKLTDLIQPTLTGLANKNASANPASGTDATNPDPGAKSVSDYLEQLKAQRLSEAKDDKLRKLLVGQKEQMTDNNERSPDQWLARVQGLRQNLAGRPLYSKSNYELITAGLVQIPYYSTKVQQ